MSEKSYDDELKEAFALLREHGSVTHAAEAAGVPRHTLSNRVVQAVIRGYAEPTAKEVTRLHRERAELKRQLREANTEELSTDSVREQIMGMAAVPPDPPDWLLDRGGGAKSGPGIPVTIWSDWHLGEAVDGAEIGNVNRFNMEVGEERVCRLVERTIDLCFEHMTNPRYPGIVVCLGGDLVSGEIHPELEQTNEPGLFQSVLRCRDILIWALESIAEEFGHVFVPCVAGNHGRNTHKIQHKKFVYRNADWLICTLVERYFREKDDDRVRFMIPANNEAYFEVAGQRFLLLHGHDLGVRGGDGMIGSLGPIRRGEIKVGRQQAQMGRHFDTLLIGHWHQYLPLPSVVVNGSLVGYSEFAKNSRFTAESPKQALFFVHARRGVTARWPVLLEDAPPPANQDWVRWSAA